MNFFSIILYTLGQKKAYETEKKYKLIVKELKDKVKRLTNDNNSLLEINASNEKRHTEDMLGIRHELSEVKERLTSIEEMYREAKKDLDIRSSTLDMFENVVTRILEKYPEERLSNFTK